MSYSLEEIRAMKPRDTSAKDARIFQLKERQAVAQKVSELIADPRFEVWGRHLEALRDHAKDRLSLLDIKLTGEYLAQEDYGRTKALQAAARGELRAYNNALALAKALIEQGEAAAAELTKVQD